MGLTASRIKYIAEVQRTTSCSSLQSPFVVKGVAVLKRPSRKWGHSRSHIIGCHQTKGPSGMPIVFDY